MRQRDARATSDGETHAATTARRTPLHSTARRRRYTGGTHAATFNGETPPPHPKAQARRTAPLPPAGRRRYTGETPSLHWRDTVVTTSSGSGENRGCQG
ncbi:MAG: hypothetical protein IKZ84_19325 [Victivallales bacterium]|nr:hypothetical protein [Victivallales bacterium]